MKTYLFRFWFIAIFAIGGLGCDVLSTAGGAPAGAPPTATVTSAAGVPKWGVRTKTSGCQVQGPLPDPACTPGDIFPNVTKDQICV